MIVRLPTAARQEKLKSDHSNAMGMSPSDVHLIIIIIIFFNGNMIWFMEWP